MLFECRLEYNEESLMAGKAEIPGFDRTDSIADIKQALDESGCVVVRGMIDDDRIAEVKAELAEHMGAVEVGDDEPEDFYPGKTRRVAAILARAPSSQTMALDPLVADLCQHHLGDNCERYQLHVSAALEVGPGAREQILHREEDPFEFFEPPRPNMIVATMWAVSEFTADNGGTLLVPGSHRWEADRKATPDEIVPAEMPKGAMLVWLGGTLHAAGANVSDSWRYGVILTYSLGWLRQEENMYLDLPPALAKEMPEEVRQLVGYPMHGALGFYDPTIAKIAGEMPV